MLLWTLHLVASYDTQSNGVTIFIRWSTERITETYV